MNIAEILKNCPEGTKLYSPIFGETTLIYVNNNVIKCNTSDGCRIFYSEGKYSQEGECVLFPSKEQRDWSKFQIPFKFGDIVAMYNEPYQHTHIAIFDKYIGDRFMKVVCTNLADSNDIKIFGEGEHWYKQGVRYATEKEKEFFFNLLKEQGYVWTGKELVNRFDLGDTITDGNDIVKITSITENLYKGFDIIHGIKWEIPRCCSKVWKIAKFDIRSLKPYDKVLARTEEGAWYPSLISYVTVSKQVYLIDSDSSTNYVIPFEGNEHLIGRWDDPDPYYITWE